MTKIGIEAATSSGIMVEVSDVFWKFNTVSQVTLPAEIQAITALTDAEAILGDRFFLIHIYLPGGGQVEYVYRFKNLRMILVN